MLSFLKDKNYLISQDYILSLGKLIQNYKIKEKSGGAIKISLKHI